MCIRKEVEHSDVQRTGGQPGQMGKKIGNIAHDAAWMQFGVETCAYKHLAPRTRSFRMRRSKCVTGNVVHQEEGVAAHSKMQSEVRCGVISTSFHSFGGRVKKGKGFLKGLHLFGYLYSCLVKSNLSWN